ncbi:hypothetical protein AHAS_Ahas17G0015400 [Arachis hypogaea]
MNKLHGTLPDTFQYLTTLNLNGNQFEGLLPKSLSKCSRLVDLNFGNNQFEDTFPNWLQNLSKLEILVLRGNKLYGHIANLKSENIFPSLIIFDISCNNFSGSLPKAYIQNFRAMKIVDDDVRSHMSYIQTYWAISGDTTEEYDNSMIATIKSISLTFKKIPDGFAIIDLSENKFEGEIPDDFGELGALIGLNLSHNSLIGPIPCSLGNLTKLESLDLSSNMLTGDIPTELANLNFLEVLNLSQNQLFNATTMSPLQQYPSSEAEDKFGFGWKPVAIGYACGMVVGIGLGYCVFSIGKPEWLVVLFGGTFPQCLANSSSPVDLDLQMNKLHGTLPDTFQDLTTLNLNGNQFEGLLPKSLSECSELVDLNLGNNQFEDTFPNWLQNLSKLEILVLRGNKLYGQIVNLKSENIFPSLIIFDISCNNFSGSLPKAYIQNFRAMKIVHDDVQSPLSYIEADWQVIHGTTEYDSSMVATIKRVSLPLTKIPRVFVIIDLSENKFEGEIPDDFGELHGLIGLNLSHNGLVGHIPHSLGNLTNLESLDLSSNMLSGDIPTELINLNFLEVLSLSQNQLVGPIPRGKQFDTFSNDSYEGNTGLCGFPLSIQCNNNVPLQQYPSSEAEDKFGFGWKPVAIGYACGMVLGIGLGYCVFSIGKPEWLVVLFGGKWTKRRSRGNRRRARTTLFQLLVVM